MITKISLHLSAPDLGDEQIVDNPRPKDGEASPQGLPQLPQVEGDIDSHTWVRDTNMYVKCLNYPKWKVIARPYKATY